MLTLMQRIGVACLALLLCASVAHAVDLDVLNANGTKSRVTGTGADGAADVSLKTCISGESACIGTSPTSYTAVAPVSRSTGGASTYRHISVGATEDAHTICTAACSLYTITATNVNAAVRYLKCFNNVLASTTPGTSVPNIDLAIPGATTGGGINISFPVGAAFSTGLTCWLVTGAAESDVAEVAANELKVLYTFKQ